MIRIAGVSFSKLKGLLEVEHAMYKRNACTISSRCIQYAFYHKLITLQLWHSIKFYAFYAEFILTTMHVC